GDDAKARVETRARRSVDRGHLDPEIERRIHRDRDLDRSPEDAVPREGGVPPREVRLDTLDGAVRFFAEVAEVRAHAERLRGLHAGIAPHGRIIRSWASRGPPLLTLPLARTLRDRRERLRALRSQAAHDPAMPTERVRKLLAEEDAQENIRAGSPT